VKNKFTLLGCGSSLGSPWITNYWGSCDKNNKKNLRTRCSAHFYCNDISVLIDTSPDIKIQFQKNKIKDVDAILYTHEHADQTSGIFELRPFFWKYKKRLDIYGSARTIKELKLKYDFCFKRKHGYIPILKSNIIKNRFRIKKSNHSIEINSFDVNHGEINSTGYVFNKIAYLSDCNAIPEKSIKYLKNLELLVIDCLRKSKHPSHFNYDEAIALSKQLKPKKTVLTNMHVDLDYNTLKKKLPKNILPGYDGLSFNF
jgi:phosphoribosyl 1,2-cyclic phosphate phosphodiesterase